MAGKIADGVAVTIFTEGSANPRCFVKTARRTSPQPWGQGCHFTPIIPPVILFSDPSSGVILSPSHPISMDLHLVPGD